MPLSAEGAALVVQGLGCGHCQVTAGHHALAAVVQVLSGQPYIAALIAATVSVDARFNDAVVVQLAAAVEGDAVASGEAVVVVQGTLGLDLEIAPGVHRTLRLKASGVDRHRAAGRDYRHAQLAAGIELNIATAGNQLTVELHPHTRFGAHQFDGAGIHAAQGRRVDGQLRRIRRVG